MRQEIQTVAEPWRLADVKRTSDFTGMPRAESGIYAPRKIRLVLEYLEERRLCDLCAGERGVQIEPL
jgi:hypothetical protein